MIDKLRALQITAGSIIDEDTRLNRVRLGASLLGAGQLVGKEFSVTADETILSSPERTCRLKHSEILGPLIGFRYMVIYELRTDCLTLDFNVTDVVGIYGAAEDDVDGTFAPDELQHSRLSIPVLSVRSCLSLDEL